ncbi:MAG: PQQ-dependent dehydrogenase, methanol/ethanol family, partial [Gammaproteobacteria bacterium]
MPRAFTRVCAALAALAALSAIAAEPRPYASVTPERLSAPDAVDWLMVRRTYDSWGYSPLEQIDTGNVAQLAPVWTFATGVV